ncbi:hypothetical protein DRW42_14040 [Pedobacter miscanthi]|uniref:Uncharacterized protein n=2 Tax=Pedobacter miscanthi TaxID=2259170 RepID=A0A366KXC8_9SPHI|nr:hypothetical protein DRW42_14040 [Pedobacter miscanthi]
MSKRDQDQRIECVKIIFRFQKSLIFVILAAMRLFYIIFFLSLSINFAAIASQEKRNDAALKNTKISFISCKKNVKPNLGFNQDNESLQRDFINSSILKTVSGACILLSFLLFLFLKNKAINTKVVIKRLKYNYWCLFKTLYPKHVFW